MPRDIIASARTSFTPQCHGFHFSNSRIRWTYFGFSGTAMCGGMTFGSLDYFRHGMPIPPDTSAPPIGSPLNRYILERQIDAHVPILLMDQEHPLSTHSHWVVAIGYEMEEVPPDQGGRRLGSRILYDNNHPNLECRLDPNLSGWFDHSRSGSKFRTYFPYDGFEARDPQRPARWDPVSI